MKKILSLTLAALLLVSMIPTAMAAENNWQGGTKVEYTAATNEQYTVTVPATLAPGGSGDVVASGTWGSNRKLTVTADDDVTLTNSINAADQKVLDVTFAGIELTGSNTESVSDTKQVAVANITDAIFGTWSGTFNYNVAMSDVAGGSTTEPSDPDTGDDDVVTSEGSATFSDGVTLTWADLKLQANANKYGYDISKISDTSIGDRAFPVCYNLVRIAIPNDIASIGENAFLSTSLTSVDIPHSVTIIGKQAFNNCTKLTTINYAGTQEEWNNSITLGEDWNEGCPEITVTCTDGTVIVPAYSS